MYNTFECLDKFATFIPENDNSVLDLVEYNDGTETRLAPKTRRLKILRHDEISDWLRQPPSALVIDNDNDNNDTTRSTSGSQSSSNSNHASTKDPKPAPQVSWTFRLFVGSSTLRTVAGLRHFPFSRAVLADLATTFQFPPAFLGYATAQVPLTTRFRTGPDTAGLMVILNRRALIVTHDAARQATCALVLGFCAHEVSQLVAGLDSPSTSTSSASAPGAASGCLHTSVLRVAAAWMNVMLQTRARRLVERKVAATELEVKAASHWSPDMRATKPLADLDFEAITRELTTFQTQLAFDEVAIEQVSRLVETLTTLQGDYFGKGKHCAADRGEEDEAALKLSLEQAKEILYGMRNATQQVVRRSNVQLQTIYSLVAQRDAEISITIAETSQSIAQAGHRENKIMTRLARQSRELARWTYRDSVGMRLMAFVNLCTLPGTFSATLLGTSFFDFAPQEGSIVSAWVWIYFAITLGLTALITLPLYLTWRRSNQKLNERGVLRKLSTNINEDDEEEGGESAAEEEAMGKQKKRSLAPSRSSSSASSSPPLAKISSAMQGMLSAPAPNLRQKSEAKQQRQPTQQPSAIQMRTLIASAHQQGEASLQRLPVDPSLQSQPATPSPGPTQTTTTTITTTQTTSSSTTTTSPLPSSLAPMAIAPIPPLPATTTTVSAASTSPAAVPHILSPLPSSRSPDIPPGTELCRSTSFGALIPGALSMEEGALYHTPGLWFEGSCRVCAYPGTD